MAAFNPRQIVDLNSSGPLDTRDIKQAYGHVGDAKAHQWDVAIVRGGAPVDLTGYTVMALVNNGVGTVEIAGTISGNVATAIFPAACYTEGVHECFMRISKASDSSEVITAKMHLNVTPSETGAPIDPGTDITATLSGLLASEAAREVNRKLQMDIPGTTQEPTYNTDGTLATVTHKDATTAAVVRTDTYTYGTNTITETRTLATGGSVTYNYDLDTWTTEVE